MTQRAVCHGWRHLHESNLALNVQHPPLILVTNMLAIRVAAARRLPTVLTAASHMSTNTRPEGSVATSKGFGYESLSTNADLSLTFTFSAVVRGRRRKKVRRLLSIHYIHGLREMCIY